MLKINDLITSGENFSVRKPKRRSAFYESASIIVQGKELDSRWDTFNLTKYMAFSEAGPNGPYGKNNVGYSKDEFSGSDQKTTGTKEEPKGIWAKAKNLAKSTWEWIKRVFKRFRDWLVDTWKKIKKWATELFKKKGKETKAENKETVAEVNKATEDIKEATTNLDKETAEKAATVITEVVEELKNKEPEDVVEIIAESKDFVESSVKLADKVITTAENVLRDPEQPAAEDKIKAIKDLGNKVLSLQSFINNAVANSLNREGRQPDLNDTKKDSNLGNRTERRAANKKKKK